MFIMPFVKASFFNLVQIVAQSMADLRWVRAEKTAAAIDREFSAVKITDCLKTGVNTAGNPERVSPVNYHTECPAQVADWLLLTCNPLIGRSPQPSGGRLARRQPLNKVWRSSRFRFQKKHGHRESRQPGAFPAHSLVEEGRKSWSYCLAQIC